MLDAGTVNLVTGGGCAECGAPAHTVRLSGERESAAQLALPRERCRDTTFVRDAAAVAQPHPETDAFRRLPFASSHEAPSAATQPAAFPDCQTLLDSLLAGNYDGDRDKSVLEAISNAISLRGERPEIHLKHKNGRVRVYTTQLSPRQAVVKTSQVNKRRATARRLHGMAPKGVARAQRRRAHPTSAPVRLPVAEQVGMVAALSISHIGFNRWRLALGGAGRDLASLPALRAARRELSSLPGKQVTVTGSGAHLVSVTAAIQERVTALCAAGLFIKRPVRDALNVRNEPAVAAHLPTLPGSPPPSVPDVQVTLGLDKSGDPGTVKTVATIINQAHPNSPSNTILAGVCPCETDGCDDLAAMLETHLPQVESLLRDGVWVRGVCRPVRLLLGSDYAAQCDVLGHKGASATRPCLECKSTRCPSKAQRLLDAAYCTLQDVVVDRHLREATHFAARMVTDGAAPTVGAPCTSEHHCSVVRSPLLAINPSQIVPIPLHTTQGVTHRYLRLGIDMVMMFRSASDGAVAGRQAGAAFAAELVELLHERVRVRPTSYHGGLFIGRDCHTIGENSVDVCLALKGKVSETNLAAYERAWSLWNRVRKTLNRAAIISAEESAQFRADTSSMVSLLKRSFPWLSISPKLHIHMCHAPDFFERFGSIGLYGEQGLEAWHGRYGQNAVKYPGATELERAAAFMREMALAREAGCDVLARYAPSRKPAKAGARKATKPDDKRRRENKPRLLTCLAVNGRAEKKRKQWAAKISGEASTTVGAYL